MAIGWDVASYGAATGNVTLSHTCTGSNLVLVVGISDRDGGNNGDFVTGVTYNGVAMTRVETNTPTALYCTNWIYILVGPETGTHDVVVSTNASHSLQVTSASYTGCKQTDQPDAHNNVYSALEDYGLALTTVADNCWVVSFASEYYQPFTSVTNGTDRTGVNSTVAKLADSNGVITPAGAYTITWNVTDLTYHNKTVVQCSIAPATAAAGPANLKTYNTNAKANIKTINTNNINNVKTLNTNA